MAKQLDWPYVINLGNSIIGVSVLAMPFCFKECGVLLGMLLLLGCAWMAGISCSLLMKAAITSKKRSYEFLALHVFGRAGKLGVELSIIGLLLGTCVAFHVVIGDLGPAILSKMLSLENTPNLRIGFMVTIGLLVALPLGLLRNIESLSNISAISLGFYCVFVAEVFSAAFPNLWSGVWVTKVVLWNPEGVFKCLPIFSLAFGCQTQLFVMYDALTEPSLSRMNSITKNAVSLCTAVYLCVGYFGYVAFCDEEISGDILMNFRPTIFSEAVKLGFVMSVAVSFPLVIFPCRTSIHTLISGKSQGTHDNFGGSPVIPELHFKLITASIVITTLVIGILVPNIEFVLALTGATMGAMICFIFPAVMFISLMSMSKTSSKSTAQIVLFLGVTVLLASTYVTLYSGDTGSNTAVVKMAQPHIHVPDIEEQKAQQILDGQMENKQEGVINVAKDKQADDVIKDRIKSEDTKDTEKFEKKSERKERNIRKKKGKEERADTAEVKDDKRHEPPVPHAPIEVENNEQKEMDKDGDHIKDMLDGKDIQLETDKRPEGKTPVKEVKDTDKENEKTDGKDKGDEAKKEDADVKKKDADSEAGKLLKELKAQREEQKELISQQRAIIEELQRHKDEAHGEVKQPQQGLVEQPAGQQPVQQPAGQQPVQQPVGQQPVQQPVGQQPVQQPAGQQPVQQPVGQQPVQQPVGQQPVLQPVGQQPVQQPAGQQPVLQPVGQQPVQQPAGQQPVLQPVGQQPVQQPVGQQPVQQPAGQQPVLQQQPAGQQPVLQQHLEQQPAVQQHLQPQPAGQQQVQQQSAGQQQLQQQPQLHQQPAGQQPVPQQPAWKEPQQQQARQQQGQPQPQTFQKQNSQQQQPIQQEFGGQQPVPLHGLGQAPVVQQQQPRQDVQQQQKPAQHHKQQPPYRQSPNNPQLQPVQNPFPNKPQSAGHHQPPVQLNQILQHQPLAKMQHQEMASNQQLNLLQAPVQQDTANHPLQNAQPRQEDSNIRNQQQLGVPAG